MQSPLARFSLILLCLVPALVQAQHDDQRNATQMVAVEDYAKVESILAKAGQDDPETHFVRMMMALKQDDTETAISQAQAALDAGLPFDRLVAGPRELLTKLWDTEAYKSWYAEQDAEQLQLLHGPMVGAVTDSAASFWVRTAQPAKVQIRIGDQLSEPVSSSAETDMTAVVRMENLEAATEYHYEVLVDGKVREAENTSFKTFPTAGQPAQFSVAFGGGAGFNPKWEYMWDTIRSFDPAAMLMLGDNVYIDQPEHLLCHYYCYYRRQARPEWQRFTASTAMYSIYDDHDFGDNDCIPGPEIDKPAWKRAVWNTFRQNWVNPSYGGDDEQPGCWYDFVIGDVHLIMLDGRYYRDLKGGSMLGPVQKTWVKERLQISKGTFKLLVSPVPWSPGIKPGSKDPWDGYPKEREELFSFIEDNKIEGVFLVAADRHRTDLRTISRPDGYTLYEIESSKLTNRHTHKVVKTDGLIWGFNTNSFALMKFDTTQEDPQVTFEGVTIDGEVMHSYTLKRSQLQAP